MQKSPWQWVPSLFAAEEIPASIVTYVAVLMFLQIDTKPALATCYCGLLFLPWVLKSFLRKQVRSMGRFCNQLQWLELAIVATLMVIAFAFLRYTRQNFWLFTGLFVLSLLTAWHELAARMYYERMLRPREQYYYNGPKILFSQAAVVLTYGLLIMFVGALQVFYRRIPRSWTEGCYLMAGIMLLFAVYHLFTLRRANVGDQRQHGTAIDAVRQEMRVIDRIRRKPYWLSVVVGLFLLLLPQSLMFYSRVLFLLAHKSDGGLGCTIQEVGFAQGTVGVIAFSIGLLLGRRLSAKYSVKKSELAAHTNNAEQAKPHSPELETQDARLFLLTLSPIIYLLMTYCPPKSLMMLCVATFTAQFLFGFGLNAIMSFVHYISGERYRNTINYFYIPLVATVMLPAMVLSGYLVELLGFRTFFLIDVLTAPVAWAYLYRMKVERLKD